MDRIELLRTTNYQFNENGEVGTVDSSKSYWIMGLLIGMYLNLIVFIVYYSFHRRSNKVKENHIKNVHQKHFRKTRTD
jgi:hypothetical protein